MWPRPGSAVLNVSVAPLRGGNSIRFGRVDTPAIRTEEVRIRITSTDGDQYQLRQRLAEPLRNEQGIRLGDEAFAFYTVRGSNTAGSLYQDMPRGVGLHDEVIYASTRDGLSDSFIIVYTFDGKKIDAFGQFTGRLIYSLEPVRGGSPQNVVLNVYADTSGEFSIEMDTSSGPGRLILDSGSEGGRSGYIEFKINDNVERKLDVYQNIDVFPQNESNQLLESEAVTFSLSGQGDIYYRSPNPLEKKPVLVCSLKERTPSFRVNFVLDEDKLSGLNLGTYRGRVTYTFEGAQTRETVPVSFEVAIQKIFDIAVESKLQGRIVFDEPKTGDTSNKEVVTIKVRSNSGRPYQVIQRTNFSLSNDKGDAVPAEHFTQKVAMLKGEKGSPGQAGFAPVKVGEDVVFTSDDGGSPSSFQIIYNLTVSRDLPAGSYSTNIDYALLEK
ncbi:hypothetical protein ACFL5X_03150 [Candidatus Omnitrophota bacterium]